MEFVFVIEEVAFGFEIIGAGDIDDEFTFEERKQFLFYDGGEGAVAVDFVFGSPGKQLLLDVRELLALQILERKFFADGENFSVHEKAVGSGFIFDRKIVAE